MGDIRNAYLKLYSNLKRTKPPKALLRLPTERLLKGDPIPLLPVLHYLLLDYDLQIVRLVASYRLAGKNDRHFVKQVFLVANRVFGLRPKILPHQFLRRDGRFVELRLRFVSDLCDAVRKGRHSIRRDITGTVTYGKRNYVVPSITRCGDDATIPPPPPGSRVSGSEKPYKDKTFTKPSYKTFRDCPRIESDILEKFQSRFEEITASSCLKEDETVKTRSRKAPRRIPKSVRWIYLSLVTQENHSNTNNTGTTCNHAKHFQSTRVLSNDHEQ